MPDCLYSARSLLGDFHGLVLARIFWIPLRAERLRAGPLNSLIMDVDNFSPTELSAAKGYLDELLTLPEANCLQQTLRTRLGYPMELVSHSLPLKCRDVSGHVLKPMRSLPESAWTGKTIIPHRGRLELPFDVLALWRDET